MWDDAFDEEEFEIALAEQRERDAEDDERERERCRQADFDRLLDAYEAEQYGPIYYISLDEVA